MTWKFPIIFIVIVLVFVSALLRWSVHHPAAEKFDGRHVVIDPGMSSEEIGVMLKSEGIIESRYAFDFYVWRSGLDDVLQAGDYILSPSMTIPEIARILSGGEGISNDVVVTIPEGFTAWQVADRLAAKGLVPSAEAFLETWLDAREHSFLEPRGERLQVRELEGYLFPETYHFDPQSLPADIATRLLEEFNERVARPLAQEFAADSYSFEEVLILASLIEDEVRSEEDRALVSGVLRSRLAIGMPLQVDATIVYATGRQEITLEDLRIQTPYNTYINRGLPPRPINNPGVSAVRAALRPQDSEYLFYLSKPDGETVFSETLEEHNAAKARYLR